MRTSAKVMLGGVGIFIISFGLLFADQPSSDLDLKEKTRLKRDLIRERELEPDLGHRPRRTVASRAQSRRRQGQAPPATRQKLD